MENNAIVLLAHGSPDSRWKKSLNKTVLKFKKIFGENKINACFLNFNKPSFKDIVKKLNAKNIKRIKILPLFLGSGGHIEKDIPKLVLSVKKEYAKLKIEMLPSIGQSPAFHKMLKDIIKQESI